MIKFENTKVFNFDGAIRGMRNPLNSWDKSDSYYNPSNGEFILGENDLDLARRLAKAGSDHRKFMRQILVCVDITAPLYWWKEFDTYKVGTVANSCSTMHKIHAKEFVEEDFSTDLISQMDSPFYMNVLRSTIEGLNDARDKFIETNDKIYWRAMIELLPSSYNQKRTITLNYENLVNMYHSRRSHKLEEWHNLCSWVDSLPNSKLIRLAAGVEE